MPGLGKLVTDLSLNDKQFQASLKQNEGLVKVLKSSLGELSNISIDPKGNITERTKSLESHKKVLTETQKEFKGFIQEQRLQDRAMREGTQVVLGITMALSLLAQGNDKAGESVKRVEKSLLAAVVAMNTVEFSFFSLGQLGSKLGGSFGALLSKVSGFAGPIGMVVGLGAALITFFQKSNDEAKKAAEEGLKKYEEMLGNISDKMQDFTPETAAARRTALQSELSQVEARLKILKQFDEARKQGVSQTINISEELIKKAGGSVNEFIRLTGKQLDEKIDELRNRARELATQLNSIPTFVSAKSPAITKDDAKARQKEADEVLKKALENQRQSLEEEKKFYDNRQKAIEENIHQYSQLVGLQYESKSITAETAIIELRKAEAAARNAGNKELELQIQLQIKKIQQDAAQAQEQALERQIDQVSRIGNILAGTGNTFLQKLNQALQVAINIARVMRNANKEGGISPLDFLEIGANLGGLLALFDRGGYTGYGNPSQPAGVVHRDEIVFENSITRRNRADLMALRSRLQAGANVRESIQTLAPKYMGGGGTYTAADLTPLINEIRQLRSEVRNMPPPIAVYKNAVTLRDGMIQEDAEVKKFLAKKYVD